MVKLGVKTDTTFSIQIKYAHNTERQTDFLPIKRKVSYNTHTFDLYGIRLKFRSRTAIYG